jgi:excisionase family DNA binding protein
MNHEISVREGIRLTGYSRQQIYNLIVNGRIPARKDGHEYRLDRQALLAHHKSSPRKKA